MAAQSTANGSAALCRDPTKARQGPNQAGGKFLTFCLGREEYGIAILKVQEIIGMMPVTPIPRTPHFIRGVVNLRGKVIPVVDLRLKFRMAAQEPSAETCIIVVRVDEIDIGIVVDKVAEVVDFALQQIEPVPAFGIDVETDYILGIGKSQGKVRILLDIERVLSSPETVNARLLPAERAGNAV